MANANPVAGKDIRVQTTAPSISARVSTNGNVSTVAIQSHSVSGSIDGSMNISANICSDVSIGGEIMADGKISGAVALLDETYTTPIYSGAYGVYPSSYLLDITLE